MSAGEPLVKRVEELLAVARETKETAQYQVEEAAHYLAQLEFALHISKLLALMEEGSGFDVQIRVQRSKESPTTGMEQVVFPDGIRDVALRTMVMAILSDQATKLAKL